MKKKFTIIFIVTLLILGALCLTYIQNIPYENVRISYAKTDISCHVDGSPPLDIQIEKNGTISIGARNLKPSELKPIFKNAFERYGDDFPIALHVDKDSKMSNVKSIVEEILLAKGNAVRLVAKKENSGLYPFRATIDIDNFKSKNVIELSGKNILLNNANADLNKIEEYVHGDLFDGITKIICSENVLYQDLINVLSICRYDIEFIIK